MDVTKPLDYSQVSEIEDQKVDRGLKSLGLTAIQVIIAIILSRSPIFQNAEKTTDTENPDKYENQKITNLSQKPLSSAETILLSRCMKFETPIRIQPDLVKDVSNIIRFVYRIKTVVFMCLLITGVFDILEITNLTKWQ